MLFDGRKKAVCLILKARIEIGDPMNKDERQPW